MINCRQCVVGVGSDKWLWVVVGVVGVGVLKKLWWWWVVGDKK